MGTGRIGAVAFAIVCAAISPAGAIAQEAATQADRGGADDGCGDPRAVILLQNSRDASTLFLAADRPFALRVPLTVKGKDGAETPLDVEVSADDARWRLYDDESTGTYHLDGIDARALGGEGAYDFDRRRLARDPCVCSYVKADVRFEELPYDQNLGANQTLLALYQATVEILRHPAVVRVDFWGGGVTKKIGPALERPGRKEIFTTVSPQPREGDIEVHSQLRVAPPPAEAPDQTRRPPSRPRDRSTTGTPEVPEDGEAAREHAVTYEPAFARPPADGGGPDPETGIAKKPCESEGPLPGTGGYPLAPPERLVPMDTPFARPPSDPIDPQSPVETDGGGGDPATGITKKPCEWAPPATTTGVPIRPPGGDPTVPGGDGRIEPPFARPPSDPIDPQGPVETDGGGGDPATGITKKPCEWARPVPSSGTPTTPEGGVPPATGTPLTPSGDAAGATTGKGGQGGQPDFQRPPAEAGEAPWRLALRRPCD